MNETPEPRLAVRTKGSEAMRDRDSRLENRWEWFEEEPAAGSRRKLIKDTIEKYAPAAPSLPLASSIEVALLEAVEEFPIDPGGGPTDDVS
jgi:hypothetical protein